MSDVNRAACTTHRHSFWKSCSLHCYVSVFRNPKKQQYVVSRIEQVLEGLLEWLSLAYRHRWIDRPGPKSGGRRTDVFTN